VVKGHPMNGKGNQKKYYNDGYNNKDKHGYKDKGNKGHGHGHGHDD